MDIPNIGDRVYIPNSMSISHGEDDVAGGLATISKIIIQDCEIEYNRIFVSMKEIKDRSYNWNHIKENQSKWKERYGDTEAKNDPDYYDYGY